MGDVGCANGQFWTQYIFPYRLDYNIHLVVLISIDVV